jgi:hypothetical protein
MASARSTLTGLGGFLHFEAISHRTAMDPLPAGVEYGT